MTNEPFRFSTRGEKKPFGDVLEECPVDKSPINTQNMNSSTLLGRLYEDEVSRIRINSVQKRFG